jgi:capsular polysaccharide transport system permease protein
MSITNGANGESSTATLPRADSNGVRTVGIPAAVIEVGANSTRSHGAERLCSMARALWKNRWKIVLMTAAGVAVAIGVSYAIPATYESTTRLLPAPRSSSSESALQRFRPELGALATLTGVGDSPSNTERFVAFLKSNVIAERMVRRFELMSLYHARLRSEARAQLAKRTTIQEDRRTGIIAVTVADPSPERAMQMAQAYTQELEKFSVEMNTTGAHLERVFLEGRVKEMESELSEASARLSSFSTSSGLLDAKEQPIGLMQQAAKLEAAIIELKAELSAQEQIYAPDALKVPRARLAELERRLASIHGKSGVPIGAGEGNQPSIRQLPKLGAAFVDRARRVKFLEGVAMYLNEKLEMAKIEEVKQLPTFRVMEPAEVPEFRVWPRRTLIVLAAFGLSLVASILFVFLSTTWRATDENHPFKVLAFDAVPAAWRRGSC